MFQKLLALRFPDLRNFALVSEILLWVNITLKSSQKHLHKYFHMLFVSSQGSKSKKQQRKRYKEEKSGCSVFKKASFWVLFALSPRLIMPYSLSVYIWNFYQTFLIVCIEMWLRFEPQIRSTKFAMNFLFIIATTERKVCFYVKPFDHFLTEYLFVLA